MNDGPAIARSDPVAGRVPGQEAVYGAIQSLWSAWARRRFRDEFERVAAFALFIGYPRSGHSLVGAMLNAHRHAVVSHELDAPKLVLAGCDRDTLYAHILARAAWFNLRGNTSNYRYQIPNRWQGRFETLRVIGDKGGGWAAQWVAKHPDLLQRIRATTGVPLRLLHVVRNPWDNVAAIARWHRLSIEESSDFYFSHCETTAALVDRDEMRTVRHEDFIAAPAATLSGVCDFLGLDHDARYLDDCGSIVFERPTGSRRRVEWTPGQIGEVGRRARQYPFLAGYAFDTGAEVERKGAARGIREGERVGDTRTRVKRGHSPFDRIAAWLSPRVADPGGRDA